MAKQETKTADSKPNFSEVEELAKALFVGRWLPKSTITTDSYLSAMCFEAAAAFIKTAAQVREGRDVQEILNPPEIPIASGDQASVTA